MEKADLYRFCSCDMVAEWIEWRKKKVNLRVNQPRFGVPKRDPIIIVYACPILVF